MKRMLAATLVLALVPTAAHAFSSVPGHADIKVKPKTKTVDGKKVTVGAIVTFKVRKSGSSWSGASGARPGLFLPTVARALKSDTNANRNATYDPETSQALKLFEDIPTPDTEIHDGKLTFDYADLGGEAAGVVSGAKLTLVTAWKYNASYAPHVYGTITNYDEGNEFVLP